MNRRRGRAGGPAAIALAGAAAALAAAAVLSAEPGADWQLVVRSEDDAVVLRVGLPDGRFSLRYRNSIYGSIAEERFTIGRDGLLVLDELAADELAVLGEYYAAGRPTVTEPGDTRRWRAAPESALEIGQLWLAATEHGQRTLVVGGREIPLWPIADTPTLVLRAELTR